MPDARIDAEADAATADRPTFAEHWDSLVTTALLGTDRREPPAVAGAIGDLVADTARPSPSQRMLAEVAACVAVRRAGVVPGPALAPLVPPPVDDRPVCVPAAAERWVHLVRSWPVLEDEWTITLIANGWRMAPELVAPLLRRHRRDPLRQARVFIAAGPLGEWLVEHVPDLAGSGPPASIPPEVHESLGELPELPIPPDLSALGALPGEECGRRLAEAVEAGSLGRAHRAVLVNLVARLPATTLADLARALGVVDPTSPGHGLASVLADLATTRHRMLDELTRP
ncbi:MAG: hypothetical protein ACR2O6_10065 [Ilumatobacteraceae bacterium]